MATTIRMSTELFNRHVVDMTFRTTYAIQRDLTLQVFLQPFVAVGDYSDIRQLAEPRSYKFSPATVSEDPDFNDKSLAERCAALGIYSRQHALCGLEHVHLRRYTAGCVQLVARPP